MDQQSQIHHTRASIQGRRVQDTKEALASKARPQVSQETGPDGHDGDLVIRQEASQAAFATGRFCAPDRQQFLGKHRQTRLA